MRERENEHDASGSVLFIGALVYCCTLLSGCYTKIRIKIYKIFFLRKNVSFSEAMDTLVTDKHIISTL